MWHEMILLERWKEHARSESEGLDAIRLQINILPSLKSLSSPHYCTDSCWPCVLLHNITHGLYEVNNTMVAKHTIFVLPTAVESTPFLFAVTL